MKRFEKHIFICENRRPDDDPRGSCAAKGSGELRPIFKKRLKELGIASEVRANGAACIDACEFGPAIVVYPEQVWYGGVTVDDIEEIIQSHIIGNKPVERLMIKNERYNKDAH